MPTWEKTNERRDRIAELTRQGLTPPVIADILHISERTVGRARRSRDVAQTRWKPLTPAEIQQARVLLDDGASYAEVERTMGRSRSAFRKHLPGYAYTRAQIAEMGVLGRMMASLERDEGGHDGFRSGTGT